ncbi:uncharacterized protein LOC142098075 [Mixophyes fleayi]|uniref:uncharacterized protein LOC142098075 n=1 Tax=Mixophyes fleayi TaxID=3061075 RepID=UPI003F4DB6F5
MQVRGGGPPLGPPLVLPPIPVDPVSSLLRGVQPSISLNRLGGGEGWNLPYPPAGGVAVPGSSFSPSPPYPVPTGSYTHYYPFRSPLQVRWRLVIRGPPGTFPLRRVWSGQVKAFTGVYLLLVFIKLFPTLTCLCFQNTKVQEYQLRYSPRIRLGSQLEPRYRWRSHPRIRRRRQAYRWECCRFRNLNRVRWRLRRSRGHLGRQDPVGSRLRVRAEGRLLAGCLKVVTHSAQLFPGLQAGRKKRIPLDLGGIMKN